METRRVVQLKVFYWYTEEVEGNTVIHVGGRTAENKTVHALINNFTCGVNVELPKRIAWDKQKATTLFKYLKDSMGTQGPVGEFKLFKKSRLHYLEDIYTIFLKFRSEKAAKTLSYRCSNARGFFVPRLAQFWADDFKVHEANIDPILKISAAKNIELANWIEIKETRILDDDGNDVSVDDRKFTTADIDMNVDCDDVKSIQPPKGVYVPPTYCSFDIECNSNNHNSKMPDPTVPENVVMQISMIFGTLYDPKRNHILISLGQPRKDSIKTCDELIIFNSETELLIGFSKLIKKHDPDLFFHYNGLKFDWDYMIKRTELLGIFGKFSDLGRIIGKKAELRVMKWSSQAYGEQKFSYLECHGRTNVDVLIEIERNHRLPNYTLNTVAARFLGQQKEDLSARDLFMIWDLTNEVLPEVINRKLSPKELILYRSKVDCIFESRKCGPIVKVYREKLLKASAADFPEMCREGMELMGTYCIQDTVLPIELVEKLNMWTSMEAMSNVTHVPVSYLHTRGQQIKVLSQVYRECIPRNIVIPTLKKTDVVEKFQGATVIEANAGDYEDVATLDFASLYPTVMIAYNISYDTILKDDDPTPDSECHVLEFKSHVGCEHDEQKRKKKAEDVLCRDYRYRFRKVKYIIDKEGNVKREHEGVMPRLERNLMASRKVAKKDMAKEEAIIKTNNGTATEDDVKFYKKVNWKIVEKGSLSEEESSVHNRDYNTFNANQLALKISCNSAYGCMGVNNGMLPLIAGAASVTAMGRRLIMMAIDRIKKEYPFVRLVYGDTDSCMIKFLGKTLDEAWQLAEEASKVATHAIKCYIVGVKEDHTIGVDKVPIAKFTQEDKRFKDLTYLEKCQVLDYQSCPIDLEFENLYKRFLLLTKKRYFAYSVNRKGELLSITKKGIVLTRRDNSKYLRDSYETVIKGVLDDLCEQDIMYRLYDRIQLLFTRQIPAPHLIIYMGVKTILNYAKSRKEKKGRTVVSQVPIDCNGTIIDDLVGPLDPRLVYPNLPQVLLALKMMRRGEDIPPNSRLEFLYLLTKDWTHQGQKAEDYTYYKENKDIENLKPDNLHYIEKQLAKPIAELLSVKFSKGIIPFVDVEDRFRFQIGNLKSEHRVAVARQTLYNKSRYIGKKLEGDRSFSNDKVVVGWDVLEKEGYHHKLDEELADNKDFTTYTFKKYSAQAAYVLDEMKYNDDVESMSKDMYPEFYELCLWYKSCEIINVLHKQFGIKKRRWIRPTRVADKLQPNVKIVMLSNSFEEEGVNKGDTGKIIERFETGTKLNMEYTYNILFGNNEISGTLIKGVPRNLFTTYTIKDGNIMDNIFEYRKRYADVVEHLNEIFSPVEFTD